MDRGQGGDVVKGEDMLVFIDLVARNLAAKDLREDVLIVIGLGGIDRH
jgi:hypothetical protein